MLILQINIIFIPHPMKMLVRKFINEYFGALKNLEAINKN